MKNKIIGLIISIIFMIATVPTVISKNNTIENPTETITIIFYGIIKDKNITGINPNYTASFTTKLVWSNSNLSLIFYKPNTFVEIPYEGFTGLFTNHFIWAKFKMYIA